MHTGMCTQMKYTHVCIYLRLVNVCVCHPRCVSFSRYGCTVLSYAWLSIYVIKYNIKYVCMYVRMQACTDRWTCWVAGCWLSGWVDGWGRSVVGCPGGRGRQVDKVGVIHFVFVRLILIVDCLTFCVYVCTQPPFV